LGAVARRGAAPGVFGLLFVALTVALLPVFLRESDSELRTRCLANVKNLAIALSMYADDYGTFPAADHWSDALVQYVHDRETYRCRYSAARCAYAFNAALGRGRAEALESPDAVVAIFESDRGWNAHGGPEVMTDFPRHLGGENVGYPDGHAKWRARQKPAGEVRWDRKWPHAFREAEVEWMPVWAKGPREQVNWGAGGSAGPREQRGRPRSGGLRRTGGCAAPLMGLAASGGEG
jgi:hypothetical protein